jgi:hypothetical protein
LFAPGLNVNTAANEVLEVLQLADRLDLVQITDHEMALAATVLSRLGFDIDPAASSGIAYALFRHVHHRYRHSVIIITGRGAKVTAAQLREEGILEGDDGDVTSLVRDAGEIRTYNVRATTRPVPASVTEDHY